jgi:hypothetical protein
MEQLATSSKPSLDTIKALIQLVIDLLLGSNGVGT